VPPGRCVPVWLEGSVELEPPRALAQVNSAVYETDPRLSEDELRLYFSSSPMDHADIFVASRPDRTGVFGMPRPHDAFNTPADENAFGTTARETLAFFASSRPGGRDGLSDLWLAARSDPAVEFAAATPIAELSTSDYDNDPFPAREGLRLYWSRARSDDPTWAEIWLADRVTTEATFGSPRALEAVNTGLAANPTLSRDERVLLYTTVHPDRGDGEVWFAARPEPDAAFARIAAVPGVNSEMFDGEPFVTGDACELYFVSDRPGGLGGWDVYFAPVRDPP
jgi:hypothetical protein